MDGVVADFEAMAQKLLDTSKVNPPGYKYPNEEWIKLRDYERFYRDMPVIPGSKEFVAKISFLAQRNGYKLLFLTAVPSGNDMPYSFMDKVNWAQEHFSGIDVWFGPYSKDKHIRATPENILIDDRIVNINEWNDAGGIGILFEGKFKETLEKLNKHMRV